MIKEALGLDPQKLEDGSYIPSSTAIKLAVIDDTQYETKNLFEPYRGDKKIMIICTEESRMTMENGTIFNTGNQPVELFVPILYLNNAEIEVEFYTPTGQPVELEMWAFPKEDEDVKHVYDKYKSQLESPKSLADFIENNSDVASRYMAVFIPGGHGALLGLPENKHVGQVLKNAFDKDLYILSICHGPGAFLAANDTDNAEDFIFNGYEIAAFPDNADIMLPTMGYLPGAMTWRFNKELEKLGVKVVNALPDKTTHRDRKLITAAGPLAANKFGYLVIKSLLTID